MHRIEFAERIDWLWMSGTDVTDGHARLELMATLLLRSLHDARDTPHLPPSPSAMRSKLLKSVLRRGMRGKLLRLLGLGAPHPRR